MRIWAGYDGAVMGQNMISIYSENRTHPAVQRGSAGQGLGYLNLRTIFSDLERTEQINDS